MAGGASLAQYDQAFRQVHTGRKGVIPASALAGAGAVGLRAAEPEAEPSKAERTREVTDLMWRMNNYKAITCDCGTKLRVPPGFKKPEIKCPHCGRVHRV